MAGKDEFMELGRLILQSKMDVVYIKNLRIEEQVNEHGRMTVRFLSRELPSPEDILRYQGSQVCLTTMEGETVFCGQCTEVGLIAANAYQEIELTAQTLSIRTDREPKTRTFQGTEKTLQEVLSAGIGSAALVKLEEDMPIKEMLSQEQETDWAFARRVANQYHRQLFVNSKATGCQIHVGEVPFQQKELGSILRRCVSRDVDKARAIQGNVSPGASVFEYEETILTVCDLTIGAGYAVTYGGRTRIVTGSLITCRQGVVENRITLANEEGLSPAAPTVMGGMGRSSILTGTVLEVEGTNVLVDFHSPNDVPRWVPYANAVSNYFYCMPDPGDTVYVYYETGDSDRIVCLGSRHVNQSPDFARYQDKMLTADNRMVRFEEKALDLVGNRMEWDGWGGSQAKIIFNDELGIEVQSTGNILLETTDGGNITIQAVVKKDFAGMDGVRQSFQEHYDDGARKYAEDGGKNLEDYNAMLTLADREWEGIKENVWGNLTSPLQLVGTLQELSGRLFGNGGEAETAEETVPDPPFEEGVIDLFALELLTVQVGNSSLVIADGVIQVKTDTYRQLGTDRSIVYEHLEDANYTWRDMFLDIAQCALDIVGALPIPGVSTAANLVNAGISLARGDYVGAAMSAATAAASLLPGANTAMAAGATAVKTLSKTAKVVNTVKGIVKIAKAVKTGADTLNMFLTTGMSLYDIGVAIHDKSFDWNDPECRQDVANLLQGMSAAAQAGIESRVAGEGADRHFMDADERKTAREQRAEARRQRRENRKQLVDNIKEGVRSAAHDARAGLHNLVENCIKACDPVEMVTGSYMFDQCDFVINDITGIFIVERTYESLLSGEDSPVGRGWTLNLFSRATVYDDRVEILLPDNHTETFLKTAGGLRNRRGGSLRLALEAQGDGYLLRDAENALLRFYDLSGRQTAVEDRNGNRTQYQYLGDTLQRIQFASGQYLDFQWQGDKVTSLQDCLGRKVTYHYQGDLLTEVETLTGGLEKYAYDTGGRLVEVTNANGENYVHNEYDARGRVTRQLLSNGQEYVILYDDANRVNTCLSPVSSREVRYHYNRERQITRVVYQDGTAEEKGYDSWENRTWERDRNGNETHRTFDEYSHLLEERFPDGRVVTYEYDGEGNCTYMRDNAGLSIRYAYDRKGNLVRETEQVDSAHSRRVSFEYDQYGRITAFTGPGGGRETYEYRHRFWAYEAFVSALGNRFEYTYDRAGRRVSATDGEGTCRYAYNDYDILCMAVNPLGETTKHVYDRAFNLVKVVRPNHANALAASEKGETYTYDAFHKRLSRTDETGAVFAVLRDVEGNVVKEINPDCYDSAARDGAGVEYGYDSYDNLCRVLYPDGGVERRWHDPAGNLVRLCRPEQYDGQGDCGAGYSYAYDGMGRLVQATAPDGTVVNRYVYDLRGNITKVINAEGMGTGETDEERIGELYTYNCLGWLTEVRKPMILGEDGARYALTQYRYDDAGNPVQEKRFLEYQTETSASGRVHTITYQYDAEDRLTRVSDCTGAVLEYRYDRQGRRTQEKRRISGTASQVLGYRYDGAGRLVEQTRTADREGCGSGTVSIKYGYDKNGNTTRILLPSGAEIRREYDDADRPVAERHLDRKGGIDNTTRFSYDRAGNLSCITDNRGRKTRMEHDLLGRETRRTERDGGVTRRLYDRNGNLQKEILPMEYLRAGDKGAGTLYAYDAMDRPVAVTRADGTLQEGSAYDVCGRLVQRWDGVGNGAAIRYDLGGRRTLVETTGGATQQFEYDPQGNITGTVDGVGNRTAYILDKWGRVTEIRQADGSSEYYAYDLAGNMTRSTDGEGRSVSYEYNAANLLSAVTDAEGFRETYAYDAEDRLCRKRDRNGAETLYTYNMYGNPLERRAKAPGADISELSEHYEYTAEGLLSAAISRCGTGDRARGMRYSYAHDSMGRLTEKSASGRTLLSLVYDLNGNLTRQEDVTGKVTEYRHDLVDRVSGVWDNGRQVAGYAYNPDGTVRSLSCGGLYTEYGYDMDRNLTGMRTVLGDQVLADSRYRHDGNGRRVEKRQPQGLTTYAYDSMNRLSAVGHPGGKEELFYDRAGNRTRRVCGGEEELYRYDSRNRLTEHTRGGVAREYKYDNAGNLLEDGRARYEYDAFNRNIKVETLDGNVQVNRYDAEGLRHEMEENGELVSFIFRDREAVAEESQAGRIRYIRTGELLASDAEYARTYYHYASDEMGSITHVVTDGEVLNRYEYDAWGNLIVCEETVPNRFRFNGQQYDPITQQYYLRARYYNPVIGRFTQEDTYRGDGLNLYAYCRNNPVYYVDPSGHAVISCEKAQEYMLTARDAGQRIQDINTKTANQLRDWYRFKDKHGLLTQDERNLASQIGLDVECGTAFSGSPLALPGPGQTSVSSRRVAAEQKLADAASGLNNNVIDSRTGVPVGRMIADDHGNIMIEPVGGSTVAAGRNGVDTHTLYPNGSNYQRYNPVGHSNNSTPHGHGHLMGNGPGRKGQGASIDVSGKGVSFNSPDAHWPLH